MRRNPKTKERASVFIIGRGLILVTLLFTVSLGFILGYLVGKSSTKENLFDNPPRAEVLPDDRQSLLTPPPELPLQPQATASPEDILQTEAKKEAKEEPKQLQKPTKTIYTVQAGAFKDPRDADGLKKKLEKRGYNTYINLSESKKEGSLYKVWIGEFSNRKEAEILSMEIKKAEGLQTFVTLKGGGQESIR